MQTYKNWQLFDSLPDGWRFSKGAGSPLHGYAFASNGIPLRGGKMALVRVLECATVNQKLTVPAVQTDGNDAPKDKKSTRHGEKFIFDASHVRTVNELARQKFKKKLLEDILVDLTICEIEGWCKREYIKELRDLLNSIKVDNHTIIGEAPARKINTENPKRKHREQQKASSFTQCELFGGMV